MNRKMVEEKARQIARHTFSDGTMSTMLYERIVQAFAPLPERPRPAEQHNYDPNCPPMPGKMGE